MSLFQRVDSVVRAELLSVEDEDMETESDDGGGGGHGSKLTICEDQAEIEKGAETRSDEVG